MTNSVSSVKFSHCQSNEIFQYKSKDTKVRESETKGIKPISVNDTVAKLDNVKSFFKILLKDDIYNPDCRSVVRAMEINDLNAPLCDTSGYGGG